MICGDINKTDLTGLLRLSTRSSFFFLLSNRKCFYCSLMSFKKYDLCRQKFSFGASVTEYSHRLRPLRLPCNRCCSSSIPSYLVFTVTTTFLCVCCFCFVVLKLNTSDFTWKFPGSYLPHSSFLLTQPFSTSFWAQIPPILIFPTLIHPLLFVSSDSSFSPCSGGSLFIPSLHLA